MIAIDGEFEYHPCWVEGEPEDGDRPVLYPAAARLDHLAPLARLRSSLTCETDCAIRMGASKSCPL